MQAAYRHFTFLFSGALLLLGLAMLFTTVLKGGGPLATGVVMGALFALLGAGRLWILAARRPQQR